MRVYHIIYTAIYDSAKELLGVEQHYLLAKAMLSMSMASPSNSLLSMFMISWMRMSRTDSIKSNLSFLKAERKLLGNLILRMTHHRPLFVFPHLLLSFSINNNDNNRHRAVCTYSSVSVVQEQSRDGRPLQLRGFVCTYHPAAPGSNPKLTIYDFFNLQHCHWGEKSSIGPHLRKRQPRVFCCGSKNLTILQQSNFSIFARL